MASSVTRIPCSYKQFFKYWLLFTAPLHHLQNKHIEVLACILMKRFELSQMITDDNIIDAYLFSTDIREQILLENNLERNVFQVSLTALRKAGYLSKDNKVNKKLIPSITKDDKQFDFAVIFDIKDDTKQTDTTNS